MEHELEARMRNVENVLARMDEKLDTALTGICDHEARLRKLEDKPAKRWEALVGQVIGLIGAGVVGYFLAK
jgi:hypothetical protein